jgi:hypothetical protein
MLLCDHIVFWRRHFARPVVSREDLDVFIDGAEQFYHRHLMRLARAATAHMIANLKLTA